MKTYQNIELSGKDNGMTKAKKGSKFCNEGKWENFIEPFLPKKCEDMTFVEFGCNASMFPRLAEERGFSKVIGIDKSRNAIKAGEKYRDDLGAKYNLINKKIDGDFDYDIPLADITLMSNFHYYLDINDMMEFIYKMAYKTCYVLIVTADIKRIHWRTLPDIPNIKNYFKGWEVIKTKYPIPTDGDTFPRNLYTILLKSPLLKRQNIEDIWKKEGFDEVTIDLVKKVINEEITEIEDLPYYKKTKDMFSRWDKNKLDKYVNKRIEVLKDVKKNGMKKPIYVRSDGCLADGTHRLLLLKEMGVKSIITYTI